MSAGGGSRGRILCVASGLPSVVYKSVELARRLAVAGHGVVYAGPARHGTLVERLGLEFRALEPSRYEEFLEDDAGVGGLRRLLSLEQRRRRAVEATAAASFARLLGEVAPDLLLIDGEMHEQILVAVGSGRRVAVINTFASIWRRRGLPPPHRLVIPGDGLIGTHTGIALLWLDLRLRKLLRAWWQRVRLVGCDRLSVLRALAREIGLDLDAETDAGQWLKPFTYRRLPVLCLQALELELPHRPPRWARYVGPMVLESEIDRPLRPEDRSRLDDVLARSRRAGGDRVLIYAGFGSALSAEPQLLRRLGEVAAGRPAWQLVIGLGGRQGEVELGPLPENVLALDWVPQPSVLRCADAAITHGGVSTINECVLARVPMLVYCGYQTDMAGNTARVIHHGAGIAGERGDGATTIAQRLDRLLEGQSFRDSLDRLRACSLAYLEGRVAERVVEGLLASAGSESRTPDGPRGDRP